MNALEGALRASLDFSLSFGKKPGTLVVRIPDHVKWTKVDGRILVRYTVEFSSARHQSLTLTEGECWDGEYQKCASKILIDARKAADKIR